MNNNLDKKVAQLIIKAQMCSDSGKNIQDEFGHPEWKNVANKYGYSHKDKLIFMAFDRISQLHGKSGFHYYIGLDKITHILIVYFNFKIDNKKYQVSFHLPDGVPKRYLNKDLKRHYTKWDRKSSREACEVLSAWIG